MVRAGVGFYLQDFVVSVVLELFLSCGSTFERFMKWVRKKQNAFLGTVL